MSFILKDPLPEFFLINNVMTEDGNVINVTTVAANHKVSCYSIGHENDVPMVYAWTKDNETRPGWWMWTSDSKETISKDAKDRLESLGYEPVVTVNSDTTSPEFHVYGKLNRYADIECGSLYLEYIPNGETFLPFGKHPSIMTYHTVYEMLGRDKEFTPTRHEYIIGLEHLHGRINDTENPIDPDAVLILTRKDTPVHTRTEVVLTAIDYGYNSHELAVLIDLMSEGRVVFDNQFRSYAIENLHTKNCGFCRYAGKKLLTENEFYELLAYKVKPTVPVNFIPEIMRSCGYARNQGFDKANNPMNIVRDFILNHVK